MILSHTGMSSLATDEAKALPSASEQWQTVLKGKSPVQHEEIPPEVVAAKTADVRHSQVLTDGASAAAAHQEHSDWNTVQGELCPLRIVSTRAILTQQGSITAQAGMSVFTTYSCRNSGLLQAIDQDQRGTDLHDTDPNPCVLLTLHRGNDSPVPVGCAAGRGKDFSRVLEDSSGREDLRQARQGDRLWARQSILVGVPLLGVVGAILLAYKRFLAR